MIIGWNAQGGRRYPQASFLASARAVRATYTASETLRVLKSIDTIVVEDTSSVPLYWGSLTTAPSSGYIVNDYYWDANTAALGGGILRYWTGAAWVEMTSAHPLYLTAVWVALADMGAWATAQGSVVAAASAVFNKLVTADAFIANLFVQQIDVPTGGRIRYASGAGVQKRCVQLADEKIDWLDIPDTTPASDELLRARIGRLGVGATILMDGDFKVQTDCPWGPMQSIETDANSFTPAYVQRSSGELRIAYDYGSTIYERISTDGITFGARSSVVGATNPYYIERASGELRILYHKTDDTLAEKVWTGSAWGTEVVICGDMYASGGGIYVEDPDGTLKVLYCRTGGFHTRTLVDGTWSTESHPEPFDFVNGRPAYIRRANGNIHIAGIKSNYPSDDELVEYVYEDSAWSGPTVLATMPSPDKPRPAYVETLNGELRIAYCLGMTQIDERVLGSAGWSAATTISAGTAYAPAYAQLANGELRIGYADASYHIVERRLQRYARIGAGIIESGGNDTDGYYQVFSDGTAECWGWGFVTWTSGATYINKTVTMPITFDSEDYYPTAVSAGSKASDPTSVHDTNSSTACWAVLRVLNTSTFSVSMCYSAAIADTARRLFVWRAKGKYTPVL